VPSDEDVTAIFCVRVEDVPIPGVLSEQDLCGVCSMPVWVSHETTARAREGHPDEPVFPVCLHCANAYLAGKDPVWEFTEKEWRIIREFAADVRRSRPT